MPKSLLEKALDHTEQQLRMYDPKGYVRRNAKKLREQYGKSVIIVSGTEVLAKGSNLDKIIDKIDLENENINPKLIAGTVDSILKGKFVWIKNDYAPTPQDMATRNPHVHDETIRLASQGCIYGNWFVSSHDAQNAADKAAKLDKKLSSDVYKKGQGYTSANFR